MSRAATDRLISRRLRWAFGLTAFLLLCFLGYLALLSVSADAATAATPFGLNLVALVSLGLVILGVVVSGLYVYWANRYFDPQIRALGGEDR